MIDCLVVSSDFLVVTRVDYAASGLKPKCMASTP